MKNLISRYYIYGIITFWAIVCFVFFQYCYPYHFFYKEQNQIFLLSWDYIDSYFDKPAWIARLIGDFLTQFYYYLYTGAIILVCSLLLMGDLLRRAFQRIGFGMSAFWIAIVVMTIEAICHFNVDFGLSSTYSIIGGAAIYILGSFMLDKKVWIAIMGIVIASFVSYWMFGYGIWVFYLLLVLHVIRRYRKKKCYRYTIYLLLPMLSFSFIFTFSRSFYLLSTRDMIIYPGIGKLSKPNFRLENYLAMDNEYYFGNYGRVIKRAHQIKERTPEINFYYNLALAQQGLLPDSLLSLQPTDMGTFYRINSETSMTVIKMMNELYYLLGDMTFAERAAMMANVFSPENRNVRMMKRLAEANLVNKDTTAAMKYLRILEKTIIYHRWAEEYIPSTQSSTVKKEIANKQRFLNKKDTIRLSDDSRFIMVNLLNTNPKNTIALDYLLCSDLLLKDIRHFKDDYDRYCLSQHLPQIKDIYQQASMIYLQGTHADETEWRKYIVNTHLINDLRVYNTNRNNMKVLSRYKNTYWYYFDFAKFKQ